MLQPIGIQLGQTYHPELTPIFTPADGTIKLYYSGDADVIADDELQAWIAEMVAPRYAAVRGMDGLVNVGTPEAPSYQIQSLDYLIRVITQIIYIAGPQHASVNYAQYPLMSLVCSAPGSVYKAPPTRSCPPVDPLAWLPPRSTSRSIRCRSSTCWP